MDDDWRFKDFKNSGGGAYNPTLAVPTSDFARANFQNQYGNGIPKPLTAPTGSGGVTASSRIIPSPSNTNWNSTFLNNQPASPSKTDWQKTFGQQKSFVSSPSPSPVSAVRSPQSSSFSFSVSPSTNQSQLSLPQSDFQDRTANLDLTTRDHELYGAGPDYGFTY